MFINWNFEVVFNSTFRHTHKLHLGGIATAILKCVQFRQVDGGKLFGQSLDPLIMTEGASLLNVYTSGRSLDHDAT